MKFYVIKYVEGGLQRLRWEGTQADVNAKHKDIQKTASGSEVIEFEVPTDKPGLLAFLNEFVTGELTVEQRTAMFHQIKMKVLFKSQP
jgi:hypothetical protein